MEEETYIERLAKIPQAEYRRLLMGTWEVALTPQERFREEVAKEYWDKVDAGWDAYRVKAGIMTWCTLSPEELHKAIVAYGRKYRR